MRSDQTNSLTGADLLLALDGSGPMRDQLARAVRAAVREGRLAAGAALPPSRALAESLGVSRWVVTEAYGELVAEGVLDARTGSATRVAQGAWPVQGVGGTPPVLPATARSQVASSLSAASSTGVPADGRPGTTVVPPATSPPPPSGRLRYDLGPGVADLRHLPRQAWARAAHDAVMAASPSDLLGAHPLGEPGLRAALAARLTVSRAVVAAPDDVVVTHGSSDGVARVARALVAAGHRALLVEDPGWPVLRDVARRAGLEPVPVPVDSDGVDTDALVALAERTGARAALVTPAHQFPSGGVLAPARREALVRWARDVDGVVLEDDYDAEFRYDRRPVAALQGLAPDRVVLVGSLSKTLAPAFGTGWLVVAARRWAGLDPSVPPPPVLHQLTFAALVADGSYDRHLRAARTRYRRRRTALLAALAAALPELRVSGVAAGLHAVLALPDGADEQRVVRLAAQRQVHVVAAGRYHVVPDGHPPALVLGYGNLVDAVLPEAVDRLADAVRAEVHTR
ncbi:PLP-dependent aminotransferase family protein [Cellulomonas sp.]|uniref:MocR-like pyridoxine biosynthesis transcription factor PdxR n=1 Tax=Cellulomonas sp. TaxID=40001 RepID=UPI001B01A4A0|nr:PLP-dependent aminotransferase family protein [Cellulomonas sp.]MBO9554672.1 PLP-dependent aminotransferase family protein [Cellulomonas sp.]